MESGQRMLSQGRQNNGQQFKPTLSEAAASSTIPRSTSVEANQRLPEDGRNATFSIHNMQEQGSNGDEELQHTNIKQPPIDSAGNASCDGIQDVRGSNFVEANVQQTLTSRPSLGILCLPHELDKSVDIQWLSRTNDSALSPQLGIPTEQSHAKTLAYDTVSSKGNSTLAEDPTFPNIGHNATMAIETLRKPKSATNHPDSEIDLTGDDPDDDPAQHSFNEQNPHIWISPHHETNTKDPPTPNPQPLPNQPSQPIRNPPITPPLQSLPEYIHNGIKLNPKTNIELLDGDFLRIIHIIHDPSTASITLRGHLFRRTKLMNGILSKKYNELCWIHHVDENDPRAHEIQAMESVPVSQVLKRRRIRITNRAFPACSFRDEEGWMRDDEETVVNERVLVCRVKYVCKYENAREREVYNWCEKALLRVRAEECDLGLAKSDKQLRFEWRGETVEGGACGRWEEEERRFLQNEWRVQRDLCVENAERPVGDRVMEDRSVDSTAQDLDSSAMSPTPGDEEEDDDDDDVVEIPNPIPEARRTFIDLTEGKIESVLSRVSDFSFSDERAIPTQHQALRRQPETLEINATIDRRTPLGTVRKTIKGRVTTAFIPNTATFRGLKRPPVDLARSSLPRKRLKLDLNGGRRSISRQSSVQGSSSSVSSTIENAFLHPDNTPEGGDTLNIQGSSRATSSTSPDPGPQEQISEWSSPSHDSHLPYYTPTNPPTDSYPPEAVDQKTPVNEQRYSFGDCFCGAGGVSRGAIMANLRVSWAFDFNKHACASYALNNPTTALYPIAAHEFCALASPQCPILTQPATSTQPPTPIPNAPPDFKVDILHLSPPCQYFSNAHTVVGRDDEMNTATLFSVQELVRKARPRVVTLEQTSGLLRRHEVWFNAVVSMLTSHEFSVRWRLLNCADYGVPQRRVRCFLVASWLVLFFFPCAFL